MASPTRTHLAFQHDGKLTSLSTEVISVLQASSLDETNRSIFKGVTLTENEHIVITTSTIFHPQGGGQPSDTGTITTPDSTFTVTAARTGISPPHTGQVLHLGTFSGPPFPPSSPVTQAIDVEKRLLYSKYHTAGHVLGSAVRHLLESQVDNFDELKANHFPDSASCEFQGLIEGKWKEPIQKRLDEYMARDMAVNVEFWTEDDFRREGVERLIPDRNAMGLEPGEKFRVVRIVGAEVYPCGGTHVDSTALCGTTSVRKISRQKGTSRVSYVVA